MRTHSLLVPQKFMNSFFFRLWKLQVRFGCYQTSIHRKTLPTQMTPGCPSRWMMTLNCCFGGLNCLVICLTLRRISRRMGWSLPPTLLRGEPGQRFKAFPPSPSQRRRSMRSPRGQSSPMPTFQSFSGTSMIINLDVSMTLLLNYGLKVNCRLDTKCSKMLLCLVAWVV